LKEKVYAREVHIVQMETSVFTNADKYPKGEYAALNEERQLWQDRYERLFENHRKLQKVNQGLEDKLLKIVDKYETEKNALNRDIANLTTRLVEARISLAQLEEENELYRNDCNIAIQLLQCKPSNFVAHRLETFPMELQQKAKAHLNTRKGETANGNGQANHSTEARIIRVPIPTFPPTAMVYSVSNGDSATAPVSTNGHNNASNVAPTNDIVSAAIMAKVLEERAKERDASGSCCASSIGRGVHKSGRCQCKCRSRRSWDIAGTVSTSCQTVWSIPADAVYNGWNFEPPTSPPSSFRIARPSTSPPTAAVHSHHHKMDPTPEGGGGRKWKVSSSSTTSTETEI